MKGKGIGIATGILFGFVIFVYACNHGFSYLQEYIQAHGLCQESPPSPPSPPSPKVESPKTKKEKREKTEKPERKERSSPKSRKLKGRTNGMELKPL